MKTADTTEIVYTCEPKPFDLVGGIIAYEGGEMDEEAFIQLFQHLLTTGLCWTLQGHYGRTATALLNAGLISE